MKKDLWSGLAIAIPTCHRNKELISVIESIVEQSTLPGHIYVYDNTSSGVAKSVDLSRYDGCGVEIEYIHLGRNIGPAGAFAAAIQLSQQSRGRVRWLMCRGDDNPFRDSNEISAIHDLSCNSAVLNPAGIGIHGSVFDWRRFVSRSPSVLDENAPDLMEVDFIPGLGTPTYSVTRLSELNVNFDSSLFFGWEEMDLGLRIVAAGGKLVVSRAQDRKLRARLSMDEDEWPGLTVRKHMRPWRVYFATRNRMKIALKHQRALWVFKNVLWVLRTAAGAILRRGSIGEARARLLGLLDGIAKDDVIRARYVPSTGAQVAVEDKA